MQDKYYVTSALSCYEHLVFEAIRRICPDSVILETHITHNNKIEINLLHDDNISCEVRKGVRREIRGFIDGFISGCEYCHTHGINER